MNTSTENAQTDRNVQGVNIAGSDQVGSANNNSTRIDNNKADNNSNKHTDNIGQQLPSIDNDNKVKIHFVAVGSAPILKRNKFLINSNERFASVHIFLRKLLKLNLPSTNSNNNSENNTYSSSNLFLYCQSAFVPSPDHLVGELRDSFANPRSNELVIHYALQEAWG